MRTLITGGSGFIGFHIAKSLCEDGHIVDLIDNFSRGVMDSELNELLKHPNMRLIEGDITKPEVMDAIRPEYEIIYHFAAIVGVANVLKRPYEVLSENLKTQMTMLQFAQRNKTLKRLLFSSTSEVYAGTLEHFTLPLPTPESTPLAITKLESPRTSYMLSKIAGEALCHYAKIPFTIIRPHNVYGPRMGLSHVVPELLRKAYMVPDGGEIEVFSANHRRSFCFIRDAVAQIRRATETIECNGLTLNVGTQEPEVTVGELAQIVARVVGDAMNKVVKIREGPITAGSVARRCPDMTRSVAATGYKSLVDIETGVRTTFNWYKNSIFKADGVCAV